MAPPHTSRAPPADDLEDLFNFSSNNNTTTSPPANAPSRRRLAGDDPLATGLGIDEEIKIRKPRAPIAKLDEDRLLSQNGIPKLRRIAKNRLKFKGKGHEFSDVSRLLNTYQLWLDELFPKANFADGAAIIEKLGHKKRLQVMRREWIEEDRPKVVDLEEDPVDTNEEGRRDENGQNGEGELQGRQGRPKTPGASGEENQAGVRSSSPIVMDLDDEGLYDEPEARSKDNNQEEHEPDEDELDALMAEDAARSQAPPQAAKAIAQNKPMGDDDEDMDALDALMAEDAARVQGPPPAAKALVQDKPAEDEDEDMDALDALLAEDAAKPPETFIQPAKVVVDEDNFGDDEEAMAAMEGW